MLDKLKKDKRVRLFFICLFFWKDAEQFFLSLGVPPEAIYIGIFPASLLLIWSVFKVMWWTSLSEKVASWLYKQVIPSWTPTKPLRENTQRQSLPDSIAALTHNSSSSMNGESSSSFEWQHQTVTWKKVNPFSIGGK